MGDPFGRIIARFEASVGQCRAEVDDFTNARNVELRFYCANTLMPRLAELDAEVAELKAVRSELERAREDTVRLDAKAVHWRERALVAEMNLRDARRELAAIFPGSKWVELVASDDAKLAHVDQGDSPQ